MNSQNFIELPTPSDFMRCPVWAYDEDQEIYREIRTLDDLSGDRYSLYDLHIKAAFTTPGGLVLEGQVVGVENVFAVGLFVGDEVVMINRNMHTDSREQVAHYLKLTGLDSQLSFETLFPLRYRSAWGGELFTDFEGVFEQPA
jgi:hypothetical protein